MAHIHGKDLGEELCGALGVDSKGVYKITIICEANNVAMVEIGTFIEVDKIVPLKKILKKYNLVVAE